MNTTTIFLLEDNAALALAATKEFEKQGAAVVSAAAVEQAKEFLTSHTEPLHAIWLDHYVIGEQRGIELLRWLKTQPNYAETPVFLVSNTVSEDTVAQYREVGIVAYYVKVEQTLKSIVRDILAYQSGNELL